MITITDKEFTELVSFIKTNYGINLTEKRHLIVGRLQNVLQQNNFNSFSDYFNYVVGEKTGEAVSTLINKLTTNHTFFLRENSHFEYFRDKVLPQLVSSNTRRDLRIWSAGCSSGEEPYTLAMIVADFLGPQRNLWDAKILATDISKAVLETAIMGRYSQEQISEIPDSWKRQYFRKIDAEYHMVTDSIKNEVIYRTFNLNNTDFPFKKKFQVIFCRNVMIYFDAETKRRLLQKFYDLLEPGGHLFIGHAETINRNESPFKYMIPAVYRKE